jgi:hypothetical protein
MTYLGVLVFHPNSFCLQILFNAFVPLSRASEPDFLYSATGVLISPLETRCLNPWLTAVTGAYVGPMPENSWLDDQWR